MQRPDPFFLKRHCDYPISENKSILNIRRASPDRLSTELSKRLNINLPRVYEPPKEKMDLINNNKGSYQEPKSKSFLM